MRRSSSSLSSTCSGEDGEDLIRLPYRERRLRLEALPLGGPSVQVAETADDGAALFEAVCAQGLEGIVCKRLDELYRPGLRRWVKVKNPGYWRRAAERESLGRRRGARLL
jgi:ATP-dependent DNA ligase